MRLTVFGVLLLAILMVLLHGPLAPKTETLSESEELPRYEVEETLVLPPTTKVTVKHQNSKLESNSEARREGQAEPADLSPEKFQKLSDEVLRALPLSAELKTLTAEEVHHTPLQIREAGRLLGKVAEAHAHQPELAPQAKEFYAKCFQRSDLPTSIRGLCLAHHRNLRIENGDRAEWTAEEAAVPEEVLRLGTFVPADS